jgi:transcriptional regulator with XRE-family HTH domain
MNQKEKEINELLAGIKQKTGLTQEQIAIRIGYNRSYISQAKKTDSEKLYKALETEFRQELENLTIPEPGIQKGKTTTAMDDLARSNLILARNNEELVRLLVERLKMGPRLVDPGTPGTIPINKKEKTSR